MNFIKYTFIVFVTIYIIVIIIYTYCIVYLMTINRTELSMNDACVFIR